MPQPSNHMFGLHDMASPFLSHFLSRNYSGVDHESSHYHKLWGTSISSKDTLLTWDIPRVWRPFTINQGQSQAGCAIIQWIKELVSEKHLEKCRHIESTASMFAKEIIHSHSTLKMPNQTSSIYWILISFRTNFWV